MEFYILYVLWYTVNEPTIYGPFKSEDSVKTYFSTEMARKGKEPVRAIIYDQSCPARKPLVGAFRFVGGEWR